MVPWFKKTRYFDNPLTNNYGRLPLSCDKTELRINLYDISKYYFAYHRAAFMVVLPPIYNTSQLVLIRLIYAPFPEVAMIAIYAVICLFLGAKGCSEYICATQRYFRRSIIRQYAPFFEVAWILIYAAF